ncbi:ADP-ribosylation factor-like protein 4C [Portunus trituberculatus]|uniref:ADP-ribosylation factor-like protein 4C n=1 Tax=Portunus trituberculatus TaxID=210409 RepID=UPI001E1CE8F8|nr:ADP-ribosylation factor-like protein 4C [Portunus trituberculatus]
MAVGRSSGRGGQSECVRGAEHNCCSDHHTAHMPLSGNDLWGLVTEAMGVCRVVAAARAGLAGLAWLMADPPQLVLVGLDSSGKTTALLRLKYGRYVNTVPTVGFNCERLRSGGCSWVAWDVGGTERVRPLWRAYTRGADAVLFVVDSSSAADRLEEARHELHVLVRRQATQSAALRRSRPPVLVLANKQDLPSARSPDDMIDALGLADLPPCQPWALAPACAVTGEGLPEAMTDLRRLFIKARRTNPSRG